jgi:hypothetical protein
MKNSTKNLMLFGALIVGVYFFIDRRKRYWDKRRNRPRGFEQYAQGPQQLTDQQG